VADRRQVKRSIRQLQYVKTWQLVVLLVLVGFVAATFLRLNNIGMVERRDAVLAADKDGDASVTQARLYDLQRYVSAHMNADMGSIYLENQYKRDSQKIIDAASADGNPNGNVYKKAQDVCAPRFHGYSQAYLQCTLDYLASVSPADNPASSVTLPRADTYRHSFVSPLWSADFAGWTVLIGILIIVMIIARMVGLIILRTILKMRDR
jgi:hypothetical protein